MKRSAHTLSITLVCWIISSVPALAKVVAHSVTPPVPVSRYTPFDENPQGLESFELRYDGAPRRVFAYVPRTAGQGKPLPMLVLLHGTGRTGASVAQPWKEMADQQGILLIAPDARHTNGWSHSEDGLDFLLEVMQAAAARYPVDGRRLYLFGHSAGGHHALDLATRNSGPFAAIAAHAAALPRPGLIVRALAWTVNKKPLLLLAGTADETVPFAQVQEAADVLAASGFPVELLALEGHNHWYYTIAGFINRRVWNHLQQFTLAEPYRLEK